jgi:hypothetical protein
MPMSASDYLDKADSLSDWAMDADGAERESYAALSQAIATAAVAAAIERLAQAVENLTGQAGQGRT